MDELSRSELADSDMTTLLDMSDEMFSVYGHDLRLVWSNRRFNDAIGEKGRSPVGLFPPDLFQGRELPSEQNCEVRIRHADGTWHSWPWSAVSGPDDLKYLRAVEIQNTRRPWSENLIPNLNEWVLENAHPAMVAKDLALRHKLCSSSYQELLGFSESELLGRTMSEIFPDLHVQGGRSERRVLTTGEPETVEQPGRGRAFPVTNLVTRFPVRDDSGAMVGIGVIANDTTERSRAEALFKERDLLLETIIEASPDMVTLIDGSGEVIAVSKPSALKFGLSTGMLSDSESGILHPDDRFNLLQSRRKLLDGSVAEISVRYRLQKQDGSWVVMDSRGKPITGDGRAPQGAIVVSREVTAEVELEEKLYKAVRVAEQASAAKSEFLSRMSHELRTPLNSVLGFSQLLEMERLPLQQLEAVRHILRAGRHLLDLIDEVLDIARIETGHMEVNIEPVQATEALRDAVDLTMPLAERSGVQVSISANEDLWVLADRQRLLQVLLNLLSNSVKYNRPEGKVDVSIAKSDDKVVISVADTGSGISGDQIHRLFEPFDRLGAEDSDVEGTGVGLTLSKQLVEQMDGRITVQSKVGLGSTFFVELRSSSATRLTVQRAAAPDEPKSKANMRILHVEDNLANLELVEQILARRSGVELLAAMHGSLAVELAREHVPDLILLDVHLPDLQGDEVLERLRSHPETAQIPVVIVSAGARAETRNRLESLGVIAFLTKPIDVHELLSVIDDLAPNR